MQFGRKSKPSSKKESKSPAAVSALSALIDELREPMDCLTICLSHSWGGLEQVAVHDSLALAELGLKTRFLCLDQSPCHLTLLEQKEVEILSISFQPKNHFDLKIRKILQSLIDQGVNLVHIHQPSLLGSIVPWLWNIKHVSLVVSRHILNDHNKNDLFHNLLFRRVDWFIVMSRTLRDNVLDTHAIYRKKVKIIHLGLDFSSFDPEKVDATRQKVAWGLPDGALILGLVGRIDVSKGQSTFIKAAAGLLKNQHSLPPCHFVIVGEETLGSPSSHLTELREMVAQFHLEEKVLFTGYQRNIPEVMRCLDILVMPSRQEAFGLVAIEAMAMECPIVLSSGGSSKEIVGNNEFGLTVRPDDAFDLQRQLRFLIEHPEKRDEMGKRGRVHVQKNYDAKTRIMKTLSLYRRTLKKRGVLPK